MTASKPFPPVFATNRPERSETVAEQINLLLSTLRKEYTTPPAIAIATAYLNPGGFGLIAGELEQAPSVRLLLGAEPDPSTSRPSTFENELERLTQRLGDHEMWLAAERDLTGFTRDEDKAARRLVDWLDSVDGNGEAKVEVRRYTDGFLHGKAYIAEHATLPSVLAGSSNMTYAGLARNAELNLGYPSSQYTYLVQEWFNEFWDRSKPYPLANLYAARWEPHSPWIVFMRMLWEYYGDQLVVDDDESISTLLRLTGFQRDGVARMLRLLEHNGGVIVADEVGLGKTFMAGEVIHRATTQDRQRVLVVSPAALKTGMWEPFLEKYDFSRRVHLMSFDELRLRWNENPDHAREELDDYALVVVDEAHNLRNPNAQRSEAVAALVGGLVPKKLVLLTATPVNNTLFDIHALISLFIRNDANFAGVGIPSIRGYIARAEAMDPESLSPEHLFDLMDQVAVRRTRRFVKQQYLGETIEMPDGSRTTIKFPTPVLERLDYPLDEIGENLIDRVVYALDVAEGDEERYETRKEDRGRLLLSRYRASAYNRAGTTVEAYQISNAGLLRSALLKRLESSPFALANTLRRLIRSHEAFLSGVKHGWVLAGDALREWTGSDAEDFEEFLGELDDRARTNVEPVSDYHTAELERDVGMDLLLLRELEALASQAASTASDHKVARLLDRLREIAIEAESVSPVGLSTSDRRKTIVFSTFADTIEHVHERVEAAVGAAASEDALHAFQGRIAPAIFGRKTGIDQNARARDMALFAPETAGFQAGGPDRYDLLMTTDVLSEGVNLQQAGRIINFDLPWNPMRLVQRHGRIDRIGSKHPRAFLDCFFPAKRLDTLLGLEERLQTKLARADAALGAADVLPGYNGRGTQIFADTREQIMKIYEEDTELLENGGAEGALSGEEYRKRLREEGGPGNDWSHIQALPFGSGSGFVNHRSGQPGYVFCARIGEHPRPWFRFVPTDHTWNPFQLDGKVVVLDDTLVALTAADPEVESSSRVLSDVAYDRAFDAWAAARDDIWDKWDTMADGRSLLPDVPRALRDAVHMVYEHGGALGLEAQNDLLRRLNTSPPARTVRAVRQLLNEDVKPEVLVNRLVTLVEEEGLQPAVAPPSLPQVSKDEVRLVVWMAVQAGRTELRTA